MAKDLAIEPVLPGQFAWLADAPLFIDAAQVEQFYDAVVQPEYEAGSTKLEVTREVAAEIRGKLGVRTEVSPGGLAKWLSKIFNVKVVGKAEVQANAAVDDSDTVVIELHPIKTPQRQLVQLTIHYLVNHSDRLALAANSPESWPSAQDILAVPRALGFIDLAPGTRILPTAAEFDDGSIVPLFLEFNKGKQSKQPDYPEVGTPAQLKEQRKEYWRWFYDNVTATEAMLVIENAAGKHGKISWISGPPFRRRRYCPSSRLSIREVRHRRRRI